ncbi:hypothetical protein ACHAWO_008804 [Cyclotella atomus]|uniref:Uncharacterized protein n=1 Tax=Cyclotella atomus TaxID=382360 RepID=A0ABD3NGT1_9STRA
MDAAEALELEDASQAVAVADYPVLTRVTFQLVQHVHALRKLFDTKEPQVFPIRPTDKSKVQYACGDASREGFANATQYPNLVIDDIETESSNLREALNIANCDVAAGRHDGCELWQATDNAVCLAVCNKGMSSVRHLFDLLVDIKVLCHSGERMIATGIDGLSRGDEESGIALGYDLRDFLPLDVSAFDYPDNKLEE